MITASNKFKRDLSDVIADKALALFVLAASTSVVGLAVNGFKSAHAETVIVECSTDIECEDLNQGTEVDLSPVFEAEDLSGAQGAMENN